MLVKWKVA